MRNEDKLDVGWKGCQSQKTQRAEKQVNVDKSGRRITIHSCLLLYAELLGRLSNINERMVPDVLFVHSQQFMLHLRRQRLSVFQHRSGNCCMRWVFKIGVKLHHCSLRTQQVYERLSLPPGSSSHRQGCCNCWCLAQDRYVITSDSSAVQMRAFHFSSLSSCIFLFFLSLPALACTP